MNALLSLWLPILLSAVVVFIISSLVHMVLKWHASECQGLANEDAVRAAINAGKAGPGHYMVPYCKDMKDMAGEDMKKKYVEGPIAHILIAPSGPVNMGKYLGQWFLLCVVVSAMAAFLAAKVFGTDHVYARPAAELAIAVSFIGYGFGTLQESIWMARAWSQTAKYLFDAALYALGTGAVFYWLWH